MTKKGFTELSYPSDAHREETEALKRDKSPYFQRPARLRGNFKGAPPENRRLKCCNLR